MFILIKTLEALLIMLIGLFGLRVYSLYREEEKFKARLSNDEAQRDTSDTQILVEASTDKPLEHAIYQVEETPIQDDDEIKETSKTEQLSANTENSELANRKQNFKNELRVAATKLSPSNKEAHPAIEKTSSFLNNQLHGLRYESLQSALSENNSFGQAATSFLFGAVQYISKQFDYNQDKLDILVQDSIDEHLSLIQQSEETFAYPPKQQDIHLIRAGAKAARIWIKFDTVPEALSLKTQLDEFRLLSVI